MYCVLFQSFETALQIITVNNESVTCFAKEKSENEFQIEN